QRIVAVRVQIDEAGGDDQAGAIENLRSALGLERADGDDAIVFDREVADLAGRAAAVVEGGAAEDDIGFDGGIIDGGGNERESGERQGKHGGNLGVGMVRFFLY